VHTIATLCRREAPGRRNFAHFGWKSSKEAARACNFRCANERKVPAIKSREISLLDFGQRASASSASPLPCIPPDAPPENFFPTRPRKMRPIERRGEIAANKSNPQRRGDIEVTVSVPSEEKLNRIDALSRRRNDRIDRSVLARGKDRSRQGREAKK